MGLDNIPTEYPCKKEGTAILSDDGKIRCEETIATGNCPYVNAKRSNPLTRDLVGAIGIFGTDCWYRGKYGNYLLGEMAKNDPGFPLDDGSFYGDMQDDEGYETGISADRCIEMSKIMADYIEPWTYVAHQIANDNASAQDYVNDWIHASFWLRYMGENCNGSIAWY